MDADDQGEAIAYSVMEDGECEGYVSWGTEGDAASGFSITNWHSPAVRNVSGSKVWNDEGQEGARPASITVRLYADGKEIAHQTVTEQFGWNWGFWDLPEYEAGRRIVYTISEDAVEGYTSSVSGSGDNYVITNTPASGNTQVNVHKVWADYNNQDGLRPDKTKVYLYANGEYAGHVLDIDDATNWYGTFDKLPAEANGEAIAYDVREDTPDGYATYYYGYQRRGYTIVDEHTPATISIHGVKRWEDQDNLDESRPAAVTIRLLANGEPVDSTSATALSQWAWQFDDVPKFQDGAEVEYSVDEDWVQGYEANITGDVENGFTITNSHVPYTTSIRGTKTWDDADDADGIRPSRIDVSLFADDERVNHALVGEDEGWTWEFTGLPTTKAGADIKYAITEEAVEGYETTIAGDAAAVFVITNTHEPQGEPTPGSDPDPETTRVSVTKVWDDADDEAGKRPASVIIRLLANDNETGQSIELSEINEWTGTFEGLAAKSGDEPIVYTVAEEEVEDYEATIDGDAATGFTVTNVYDSGSTPSPDPDPDPDPQDDVFTITYKLNGGTYDGSTEDILETYKGGTKIAIHEAPTRDGHTFLYWKGSEYQPGDEYTVVEDHTFVAQWRQNGGDTPTTPSNPSKPSTPSQSTTKVSSATATTTRTATPTTGDESSSVAWLLLVAAFGFIATGLRRRHSL